MNSLQCKLHLQAFYTFNLINNNSFTTKTQVSRQKCQLSHATTQHEVELSKV